MHLNDGNKHRNQGESYAVESEASDCGGISSNLTKPNDDLTKHIKSTTQIYSVTGNVIIFNFLHILVEVCVVEARIRT